MDRKEFGDTMRANRKVTIRVYPKTTKRGRRTGLGEAIRVKFAGREKWFIWRGWKDHDDRAKSWKWHTAWEEAHILLADLRRPGPTRERALRTMR